MEKSDLLWQPITGKSQKKKICDAPTQSFHKGIKSHSGCHSFEHCIQEEEGERRVVFPEIRATLRTDESFLKMLNEAHHVTLSPLTDLNIGLKSQCVLDCMDLVC